jgi:C-8 sterol isomerase
VFNNAGGAMGQMLILHASITEYVIIFGTPNGTEGATGRFAADDWFIMLEGEHWCYGPGDLDRVVTRPGEVSILRRGESKAYRLPDRAFALEYARGNIPMMLPFGFADTFSSTLDFRSLWRTMNLYTRAVVKNLAHGKI